MNSPFLSDGHSEAGNRTVSGDGFAASPLSSDGRRLSSPAATTSPDSVCTAEMVGAKTILLVDDTEVLRERLAMAMRSRGLEVRTAGNFDEAVAVFSQSPTDLAVL